MKRFCMLAALLLLLPLRTALAWEEPCISPPYDYSYEDERRMIAVSRMAEPNLTYFVADVQLAEGGLWQSVCSDTMRPLTQLLAGTDAVLAINGDDYGAHNYGVIIRNGELLRARDTTRHMLTVDRDGTLRLLTDRKSHPAKALAEQLLAEDIRKAYEFGPALVEDGQALSFPKEFDVISTRPSRKEPRTAIGQLGPLHYCIIVVDGRQPGYSEGISLQDLQQLFLDYGAQTAFNLDGGGSTELWFMGEILNQPCGGHERSVSDGIFF